MSAPPPASTRSRRGPGRTRPHRARKGEGDRLRRQLLDAAEELLAERGSVEAVTLRDIARRCGVSATSIYLHFPDKESLFFHCCSRRFVELIARLSEVLDPDQTVVERLIAMGRAYVDYGLERGNHYRVLFVHMPPDSLSPEQLETTPGRQAFSMLVSAVAEGIASGELRNDRSAEEVAVALWATVHGLVLILLGGHQDLDLPRRETLIEATLEVLRQGIVPPPA